MQEGGHKTIGKWEYTLGKAISWDEGSFVSRYPRHIAQAFIAVDYDDCIRGEDDPWVPYQKIIEEAIQRFTQRWGGLDDAVFVRVLHEARGRDRLAAIFAIGHNSALTDATDLLAPFLTSSDQLERCAAACMFTLRRDERALPVLEEYLLHEPPADPEGRYTHTLDASVWYASERCRIASALATWGPSSVIWLLRRSFIHLWELEGPRGSVYDHSTQDALCYALGRRGALAALHGIPLTGRHRRLAMIFLALGYVRADERFDDLNHQMIVNEELKQELVTVLKEHFALSEEESKNIIDIYMDDFLKRHQIATYVEDDDEAQDTLENVEHKVDERGK